MISIILDNLRENKLADAWKAVTKAEDWNLTDANALEDAARQYWSKNLKSLSEYILLQDRMDSDYLGGLLERQNRVEEAALFWDCCTEIADGAMLDELAQNA